MSAEFQVQLPAAIAQLEAYYSANWAVADWYIDGVVGNDSNTGTSAAAPLKTGRELKRRLGNCAEWDHSVTIHVLANGMTDPLVINGLMLKTTIHVDVIGTPTVIATDTVAAYSGRSHTTARAAEITVRQYDAKSHCWPKYAGRDARRLDGNPALKHTIHDYQFERAGYVKAQLVDYATRQEHLHQYALG